MVARFGISTPLVMASDLPPTDAHATQLLGELTRAAGGDVYLSGPSGRDYLEPALLGPLGVELRYHEFQPFEYPQLFGEFAGGLSCLDYIANVGLEPWGDGSAAAEPAHARDG